MAEANETKNTTSTTKKTTKKASTKSKTSKKKKKKEVEPKPTKICTCCNEEKILDKDFYISKSFINRGTERMPICKKCLVKLFDRYYKIHQDNETAMYYTCRKLDICFNKNSIEMANSEYVNQVDRGKCTPYPQIYMTKVNSVGMSSNGAGEDFDSSDGFNLTKQTFMEDDSIPFVVTREIKRRWGLGYTLDQYRFLEEDYADWCESTDTSKKSVQKLLQRICCIDLEIYEAKAEGNGNTEKLETRLIKLMDSSKLSPKSASDNALNKGQKMLDDWIVDIEKYEPCQYFDEKAKKYSDYDNFGKELRDKFRCLKNLITGSKDKDPEFSLPED